MSDDSTPLPTGLQLTGLDPEFRENPHPRLDRLRIEAPRYRNETSLFLTSHADARIAWADPTLSRDPRKTPENSFARMTAPRQLLNGEALASMFWLDDPEHAVNRGLVQPAFFKRCAGMRARVTAIVEQLLADIEKKHMFDGIDDFAVPLPVFVIADILGFPRSDMPTFRERSVNVATLTFLPFRTPEQDQTFQTHSQALREYFQAAIDDRRASPKDDLTTDLVHAEGEGRRLDDEEIISTLFLLLLAGNLTTTDLIGNGIVLLLTHAEEATKLRANPRLARSAVEEILRFDPPVPAAPRFAIRSQETLGCPVHAGDTVVASIQACNRDPSVFEDPHAFRIEREANEHVSFGGGVHHCLGAPLARLEGEIAFAMLFQRFPHLRLAAGVPARKPSFAFTGYEKLPLSID